MTGSKTSRIDSSGSRCSASVSGRSESGIGARVPVSRSQRHGRRSPVGKRASTSRASVRLALARKKISRSPAAVVDEAHVLVRRRDLRRRARRRAAASWPAPSAAAPAARRPGGRRGCSRPAAGGPGRARGRRRPRRARASRRATASFTRRSASAGVLQAGRAIGRAADEDDPPARLAEAGDRLGGLRLERDDVHDDERAVGARAVAQRAALDACPAEDALAHEVRAEARLLQRLPEVVVVPGPRDLGERLVQEAVARPLVRLRARGGRRSPGTRTRTGRR